MFSSLNEQIIDQFLTTEFQMKNKWEFILLPSSISLSNVSGTAASAANVVLTGVASVSVVKLYLRSITFPPSVSFDYTPLHEQKYISAINQPETITLRFIEDEWGSTIRYLRLWVNDTYVEPDPSSVTELAKKGIQLATGAAGLTKRFDNGYVLKENQIAAKRIGILLLDKKTGEGVPTYPRIMMYGLGIKSISEVTLDHESKEPLEYEVTCSVDRIYIPTII